MSTFLNTMIEQARTDRQTIVLPEGSDPRTLEAAREIIEKDIADLIILGDETAIEQSGIALSGAKIVDPATSPYREEFIDQLVELRRHKGHDARESGRAYERRALLRRHDGQSRDARTGMVAGACHTTGDVLRPCLQILKTAPGVKLVSSFFRHGGSRLPLRRKRDVHVLRLRPRGPARRGKARAHRRQHRALLEHADENRAARRALPFDEGIREKRRRGKGRRRDGACARARTRDSPRRRNAA